jgi:hypothetical protein
VNKQNTINGTSTVQHKEKGITHGRFMAAKRSGENDDRAYVQKECV